MEESGNMTACVKDYPICWDKVTETILVTEGVFIILVNLLHICVIYKLLKRNYNSFKIIVFATSATDMLYTVGWLIGTVCIFRRNILLNLAYGVLGSNFASSGFFMRYNMLALQSIERAYALKAPFSYENSFLVKHTKLTIMLLGACTLVSYNFLFVPLYVLGGRLCIDIIFSINIDQPISLLLANIFLGTPSMLTVICIAIIVLELRKLLKSPTQIPRETIQVSIFIILSALAFALCLLPVIFRIVLVSTGVITENIYFQTTTALIFPLYGLLNTLLYAGFSPPFRTELKQMLSCLIQVHPRSSSSLA